MYKMCSSTVLLVRLLVNRKLFVVDFGGFIIIHGFLTASEVSPLDRYVVQVSTVIRNELLMSFLQWIRHCPEHPTCINSYTAHDLSYGVRTVLLSSFHR